MSKKNNKHVSFLMFLFTHSLGNGIRQMYHASSATMLANNSVKGHGEGKVARWAVAFDRLLEDKTGLEVFRVGCNTVWTCFRTYPVRRKIQVVTSLQQSCHKVVPTC